MENYRKIGKVLDGAFMPSQEVIERFYSWLSEHATSEVSKKISEREAKYTEYLQKNYQKSKKTGS